MTDTAEAFTVARGAPQEASPPTAFTPRTSAPPGERAGPAADDPKALTDEVAAMILLEENWDGSDAPEIDASAISHAVEFLRNLKVPWLPWVAPTAVGGVRVEWEARGDYLMIDFEPDNEVQVIWSLRGEEAVVLRNDEIDADLGSIYSVVLESHLNN